MLFLHHTAGTTADGAISWWNQTPEKVGTPYVIDRDGSIYEVFNPKCWSYHLGIKGDDDYVEKYSIGIEIVAAGQLKKEGDKFMFYPLWPSKVAGKVIPNNEVWDMGENLWVGERYYHSYTDAQINSVIELVNKLKVDFKITLQENLEDMGKFNPDIYKKHLPGIWAHTAVRKDKNDIVPYPPFMKRLIEGIKPKTVQITENTTTDNKSNKSGKKVQ